MGKLSVQDLIHKRVSEFELQEILEREDINTRVINGNLAFIGFSDENWLDLLIKYGLDVNYINESGENALWYTSNKTSDLLIKRGVNVNNADVSGRNALWYSYHDTKKYEVLIKAGINVNQIDNNGENVLFKCPSEQFSLLIKNGADPYILNKKNENLLFSCSSSDIEVLERNNISLDYNVKNNENMSVMKHSLINYSSLKTKMLKEKSQDEDSLLYFLTYINKCDDKYKNSKFSNFNEVFPYLFEKEDLSLKNEDNKSLIDLIEEILYNNDYRCSITKEVFYTHPLLKNKQEMFSDESDMYFYKNEQITLDDLIKLKMSIEKIIIEKNIFIDNNENVQIKKRI